MRPPTFAEIFNWRSFWGLLIVDGLIVLFLLAGCAGPATKAPYYWCQPMTVQEEPGLLCAPVHPKVQGARWPA